MQGSRRRPRLGEYCLRVDALRVVADKQQHLGRSARGNSVRLQQFWRAGGRQRFQVSVVLLDLGIQQQPAPGDCAQARLGRCQRGSERARPQGYQPPQESHLAADLVELLAQGIRRADDDCLERLHGLCPGLDRGVASDLEMTDHLDSASAGLRRAQNEIDHRLTKPKHPWTNGQVERMNRTIKDATVKRYFYETHDQLRTHLRDFVDAYNFGRRLKTLNGLTPFEFVCKRWTTEPEQFRLNPLQQMPGLNS